MKFTKEEVANLADLAKLKLDKKDQLLYQKQLKDILVYVNKINELDLTKVEESLTGVSDNDHELRQDKVEKSYPEIIGQASQIDENYMVAPRVFKK